LNLYTFGLLASVFRRLHSSIANHHLTTKQPAEGVPFYKISKILEKGTPQSRMEVVSDTMDVQWIQWMVPIMMFKSVV